MLEAETETNEEEANEETYHDDKRSRVAVKNLNLNDYLFHNFVIYFSGFFPGLQNASQENNTATTLGQSHGLQSR